MTSLRVHTEPVLTELRAACGGPHAAPGTAADAIGGLVPDYVAAPASTAQAAAVIRVAAARELPVVVRGGGTKQGWGAPPRALGLVLDTGRMTAILEHAAGDLVVRTQAGVRPDDLATALAASGQRLALDPMVPGATLGGTVAAGVSGPLRLAYGSARDLLIGITVVRADGAVARSGGKVVKNVAGYDLGRLYAGSLGTLGVITELIFRLHPRPRARAWVSAQAADPADAGPLLAAVTGAALSPAAAEADHPAPGAPVTVTALLEGEPASVAARAAACAALTGGTTADQPPPGWARYPFAPGDTAVKITVPVADVAGLIASASASAQALGLAQTVRGSAAGALYLGLPSDAPPQRVADHLTPLREHAVRSGGALVVLHAADELRAQLDLWGEVPGLNLMRRVKDQFDPEALLAPGRFAGGI